MLAWVKAIVVSLDAPAAVAVITVMVPPLAATVSAAAG